MSRILKRPIEVLEFESDGLTPRVFRDRDTVYVVTDLIDRWAESGDWLKGEGTLWMFRVLTKDMSIFDIERAEEPPPGTKTEVTAVQPVKYDIKWYIYRAWD